MTDPPTFWGAYAPPIPTNAPQNSAAGMRGANRLRIHRGAPQIFGWA